MEIVSKKLKTKSKPGRNHLKYITKKDSGCDEHLEKTSRTKFLYDKQKIYNSSLTFQKKDISSSELCPSPQDHDKRYSFKSSSKNLFILPIDFSRTFSISPNDKLLKTDEFYKSSRIDYSPNFIVDSKESHIVNEDTFQRSSYHSKASSVSFNVSDNSEINFQSERNSIDAKQSSDEIQIVFSFNNREKEAKSDRDEIQTSIREQQINHQKISYLNFEDCLIRFNSLQLDYTGIEVWIFKFSEKICCVKKKVDLGQEIQETCEKLIIFSYVCFDMSDIFHASILFSVLVNLKICSSLQDLEKFKFNAPYQFELLHNVANFGLLFIMFMVEFLQKYLDYLIDYCEKNELVLVSIIFDLCEMAITLVRRRVLNRIMVECQKCLEIVFFFTAGCLGEWFNLHLLGREVRKNLEDIEKQALRNQKGFINLGKELMNYEVYK